MAGSKEPQGFFAARLLEKLLVALPFGMAQALFLRLGSLDRRARIITVAGLFVVSVILGVFLKPAAGALNGLFVSAGWSFQVKCFLRLFAFYGFYLVIVQPCFLALAYAVHAQKETLLKDRVLREPQVSVMRKERARSDCDKSYLGHSFHSGESVFLSNEQRLTHMQVVGSTGTGKTESVLLPLLAHDIKSGKGAVLIDGKGDLSLLDRLHFILKKTGRLGDFYFFSLAHPKLSNTYNPLLRGNPTELKDKIVGSMAWSEEFYRRMAEQAAFTILAAMKQKNAVVKFEDLHRALTDYKTLNDLARAIPESDLKRDLEHMIDRFKDHSKFLSGLIADLYLTSRGEFGKLLNVEKPDIDLLDAYQKNKIVYFQLNLQGYGDTAKRMGRMILQDIKTVSSHIQAHFIQKDRHFFPVFVDDASSFLELNFIDFLNKARAAHFGVTLLHQSLGDLVIRRDASFQQQVIENTNIKIILRQDDPESVETFARIAGTRKTLIATHQTEEKLLGKSLSGMGSLREGQTFRIEPDLIRALKRGEAALIWKSPAFHTDYVKLDFFGHPPYPGIFKPNREEKPAEVDKKKEESPELVAPKKEEVVVSDGPHQALNRLLMIEKEKLKKHF